MFPSQNCTLAQSSLKPLKTNKLLSNKLKEPSSWLNKPCKTKSQQSFELGVKHRLPNCSEKLWRDLQLSWSYAESRQHVTSQPLYRRAGTESSSNQTLYYWILHPVWMPTLRRDKRGIRNQTSNHLQRETKKIEEARTLSNARQQAKIRGNSDKMKSHSNFIVSWTLQQTLLHAKISISKTTCFIHYFN